jgi:tetratricopeptide (TPR) repeat protein
VTREDDRRGERAYRLKTGFWSLAVRGRYDEALAAYRRCCTESPDEPEPYRRIARLCRDELQPYDQAIAWFKKARSCPRLRPADDLTVSQEIIETHTGKLRQPAQAVPELARLAERFPSHPAAAWAKRRLAELRAASPGGAA